MDDGHVFFYLNAHNFVAKGPIITAFLIGDYIKAAVSTCQILPKYKHQLISK